MTFEHGEKVAVYFPLGRQVCTVKLLPYMPYIIVEDQEGKDRRVHPKQCRKLKQKKELTKHDFKIGDMVVINPTWSTWFCEHLDTYYRPLTPNQIDEDYRYEVAAHMIVSAEGYWLAGKVIGYGMDESVRIEINRQRPDLLFKNIAYYIGPESLKKSN